MAGVPVLVPALFASNGASPASGAKLYAYIKGTTTPQTFYTDEAITTPAANPTVANSLGATVRYLDPSKNYDLVAKTSDEATTLFSVTYNVDANNITLGTGWEDVLELPAAGILDNLNGVRSVATHAALTALTTATGLSDTSLYHAKAKTTQGDSGAGTFEYVAASTATVDGYRVVNGPGSVGRFLRRPDTVSRQFVTLEDFYSGPIPFVSPLTLNYADRQLAPDITTALRAAVVEAAARAAAGVPCEVRLPTGLLTVSNYIRVTDGVFVKGSGVGAISASATHIRRIHTTGNTFEIGDPAADARVFNAGVSDLIIYQDHGGNSMIGYENPVAASFINKATAGAHVIVSGGYNCIVKNVQTFGLRWGFRNLGGAKNVFDNCGAEGIWDSASAARQEGLTGIDLGAKIDTGPSFMVPTYIYFINCRVGGATASSVSVSYPGPNSKTTVRNIGFQYGVDVSCNEECYFIGLNAAAAQKSSLRMTSATGRVNQGLMSVGAQFGPCGTDIADAMIKFENEDTGGEIREPQFVGTTFLGQTNGYRAVSDYGSTATNGSVAGLRVEGIAANFVGSALNLINVRHANIDMAIRNVNCENYYTSDSAACVYLGSSCRTVEVKGVLGGAATGATSGHYCIDGVRAANAATSRVSVRCTDGGLSGGLFVSNSKVMPWPSLVDQITLLGDAGATLTWGSNPPYLIQNATLTADRVVTLSTTDTYGRAVAEGTVYYIKRDSAGAFNLTVNGSALAAGTHAVMSVFGFGGWQNFIIT